MHNEIPNSLLGGKAPIVQPNYGLLSTYAAVHRGAGQRLIAELLQRLGVHILSSRAVKVSVWSFQSLLQCEVFLNTCRPAMCA